MNEYIFYSTEGQTEAPNKSIEVENCQVIGCAKGVTKDDALLNLLKENPWINEAKYNTSKFIIKQLLTNDQRDDIRTLLSYLWDDEETHFEESDDDDKSDHIFNVLKRLKMAVEPNSIMEQYNDMDS